MVTVEEEQNRIPELNRAANEVKREAPCFGNEDPFAHEYASGECAYCGFPQPGNFKGKQFKPIFDP